MNKIITIEQKNIYGLPHILVTSKEHSKAIEKLTRRKTLNAEDMKALTALGFEFKWTTYEPYKG